MKPFPPTTSTLSTVELIGREFEMVKFVDNINLFAYGL